MKTLQEHYNAIQNGKGGNKAQFLRQARQLFPQYINQYSDFDTATRVLKSKQVISEANAGGVVSKGFDIFDWKKILAEEAKAEEKNVSKEVEDYGKSNFNNKDMKNADNINFNEIMKGFYAELKDAKNHDKTGDEIKDIVVKNLAKDPLYYTKNGEFGVKGVGYTDDAPGLSNKTQPKTKEATVLGGNDEVNSESDIVKDSLVGSTKKNVKDTLSNSEAKTSMPKKVKEMPDKGVKGVEKKIKLQESVNENEALYQQLEDLQNELMSETDPERKKEIEAKIQALEAGLYEAMVQGTIINPKGGGGGEKKVLRAVFLSKEVVDQINTKFPGSIKLVSKGKNASMFISQLFATALGALSRGRYSPDTERKKPELAKFAADLIPSLLRSKIKSSMNPKPTQVGGEQMHYIELNLVPKNDGSGYWIPLKGEFDPLVTEAEKKIKMPGAEKKIKLKENKENLNLSQYDKMPDHELIQWAKEDGMEDFIEYDEVGELSNRRELLSYLLGKELEYDNEHGDFDYDTRDQEAKWDDDDLDPAGGRGLSSHLEENKPGVRKSYKQEIDWIENEVDFVPDEIEVYEKWPEPYKTKALKALEYRKKNFNQMSKDKLDSLKENINKKYTHFAIRKSDNKIVNGWETISDVDSLKYYAKMDLKDIFPDSKISDFIIYSKNALIKKGIDPFDIKNWESYKADKVDETDIHGVAGNPDEEVEYKKAQIKILDPISAQIADLEQELMSTTDSERKAEIELKIKELQSGLQEEKLRVLIREIIEEEITKR